MTFELTTLPLRLRRTARALYYRSGAAVLARSLGLVRRPAHATARYWDEMLAGPCASYLGGTVTIAVRDALVRALVSHHCPGATSLLDVGCAAGSLVSALRGTSIRRYLGLDISSVAVRQASARVAAGPPDAFVESTSFSVADVRQFVVPLSFSADVLVFNEVLYYFDVDEAVSQVARLLSAAAPGATAFVSMKDDPKSAEIFRRLASALVLRNVVLFQEKGRDLRFRVAPDRARPAYVLALLQAPNGSGLNAVRLS